MIPYLVLFLLLLVLAITEQIFDSKYLGVFKVFVFVLLVAFAAFRPEGGDRDYENYIISFDMFLEPMDFFKNYSDWVFFEPMYYLIPSFYKTYLSASFFALLTFITFALIAVGLKIGGITKLSNFFFLSVILYFSHFFLLQEMTQIRAGVAAGFLLISVGLIVEKRYLMYALMVAISMLFHYSSFVMLFLLFFKPGNLNRKVYLGVMAITLLLSVIDTTFVFSFLNFDLGPLTFRSANYLTISEYEGVDPINKLNVIFLISFLTTGVLVFFNDKVSVKNPYASLMLKMQVVGLFFFQLFSAVPIFSFRLSELLVVTQIITIPLLVYLFRSNWIGFGCVIGIAAIFLYINLFHLELMNPYF